MVSFWKNAGIMASAEIFLKLKALFMLPLITKYLGTMNYGIWSQVMVIVAVLNPLVFWGMENSLTRFLPGLDLQTQKRDFTGWILFGTITSFILLFIISISSFQLSDLFFGSKVAYPIFVILAGYNLVTTSILNGIRYWFRIQNSAWSLVTLTIAQNLLQMFVLIAVLIANRGIYQLIVWSLYADLALLAISVIYMFKKRIFVKPSMNWLKPYFKFGVVLIPGGYAVWILNSLDRVFLAQYHTLSDIGIYSICFTIGYTIIQIIVNPIWNLFPSKAAELYNLHKISELNRLFNQSIKLICWIVFPSIVGLLVIGDQLLRLLTTNEFANGAIVLPIILLGYMASMLSSYFETILFLKNKQYYSTYFIIISGIANLGLNFLLIPKYSYKGAAIATTLSFGLQLVMSIFFSLKENLLVFEKMQILRCLIASVAMYLIIKFLPNYTSDASLIVSMSCTIMAGIFIYLVLTMALGIFSPSTVLLLLRGKTVEQH